MLTKKPLQALKTLLRLLKTNAGIFQKLVPQVATNPVDSLANIAGVRLAEAY